ncbi:MAG: transcriptional regulator [Spirochaetes bacterium GWC2_52_13]|nr:MAG: transcriptional regulator [Spirochaetes bacterium GWC2_52_13]HCG64686.1 transcriptional regulator [Sphaerochaeta sp.]
MKADHKQVTQALKTARGQLDGILRMVEEDRYCVDISNQLLATEALLKKTNKIVLQAHLQSCVKESFETETDVEQKISEILKLLDKLVS